MLRGLLLGVAVSLGLVIVGCGSIGLIDSSPTGQLDLHLGGNRLLLDADYRLSGDFYIDDIFAQVEPGASEDLGFSISALSFSTIIH